MDINVLCFHVASNSLIRFLVYALGKKRKNRNIAEKNLFIIEILL